MDELDVRFGSFCRDGREGEVKCRGISGLESTRMWEEWDVPYGC